MLINMFSVLHNRSSFDFLRNNNKTFFPKITHQNLFVGLSHQRTTAHTFPHSSLYIFPSNKKLRSFPTNPRKSPDTFCCPQLNTVLAEDNVISYFHAQLTGKSTPEQAGTNSILTLASGCLPLLPSP